jgi:hypothetical protein
MTINRPNAYEGTTVARIESISRGMVNACLQHPAYEGEADTRGLCGSTAGTTHPQTENRTKHGIVRVSKQSDGRPLCSDCREIAERMGVEYSE